MTSRRVSLSSRRNEFKSRLAGRRGGAVFIFAFCSLPCIMHPRCAGVDFENFRSSVSENSSRCLRLSHYLDVFHACGRVWGFEEPDSLPRSIEGDVRSAGAIECSRVCSERRQSRWRKSTHGRMDCVARVCAPSGSHGRRRAKPRALADQSCLAS